MNRRFSLFFLSFMVSIFSQAQEEDKWDVNDPQG
ncbi:MAG: hypothetical protein ACI84C_002972, partial [Flavobacteriales bacterium]